MENGRNICASFDKKKPRFIKIQEASRLKLHYIIVSKKFRASKIANKLVCWRQVYAQISFKTARN